MLKKYEKIKKIFEFFIWLITSFDIKIKLNAHALGVYKNQSYTNSKEAFECSYNNGFRYFETDISITKDDQFVLSHELDKVSNYSVVDFYRYISEEKNLQALSLADMFDIMKKYPDINIMFDFLPCYYNREEVNNLLNFVGLFTDYHIKKRTAVEVYSKKQVLALKGAEYDNIMFFVDTDYAKAGFSSMSECFDFILQNNIKILSVSFAVLSQYDITSFLNKKITIYSPGYNNLIELKRAEKYHVDIVTTDFLTPNMLKYPFFSFCIYIVKKILSFITNKITKR